MRFSVIITRTFILYGKTPDKHLKLSHLKKVWGFCLLCVMREYRPLYESLEFRITVDRVCRSLGFVLQTPYFKQAKREVKNLYFDLTGELPIKGDKFYILYPGEFIPVIKNIVLKYKELEGDGNK